MTARRTVADPQPKLLDLFSGAGGAAMGYHRAGFDVVGVDIKPQPNYPFEFHQGDALEFLRWDDHHPRFPFDAIHASPPCQHYANVTKWTGNQDDYPDLIDPVREKLDEIGLPWVIENVRTDRLKSPFVLCGSMFGIKVIRHRYFESNVVDPGLVLCCDHRGAMPFGHKYERKYADEMGCDWMTAMEGRQAIPPAYTEFIGEQLLASVSVEENCG